MTEVDDGVHTLQVAHLRADDAGRGIARLSRRHMRAIGLTEGQPLAITGRRRTAAIAMPAYAEDEELSVIRLDGLLRGNAGTAAGEEVEVAQAEISPARRITLAPAQKNLRLQDRGRR